jgi:diketogulonate reductase-like aldo/keto reductase
LVSGIGGAHNKTGAQASLRWIYEHGVSLTTKTTKESHMQEDLDVFSFELAAAEKVQLDAATSPAGKPSFMCTSAVSLGAVAIPNVKLNNGVEMPMMSMGTWQYDTATAQSVVSLALKTGFNHIDTANNYKNQEGVGAALKGVERSSYFLTTKVPAGDATFTSKALQDDLDQLGLDFVDLMLVHYPPQDGNCQQMQEQWGAMEAFYKAGKARAIGVSNYCPSSLECIKKTATVTPAVNQVQYHVGMGADPTGLKSYCDEHNIHLQAYSPLGDGTSELITGDLVSGIGGAHNKTGAQASLRWIYEHGVSLTTKTTKESHMREDLDVFSFELAAAEKVQLDAATSPAGKPSFMCTSAGAIAV